MWSWQKLSLDHPGETSYLNNEAYVLYSLNVVKKSCTSKDSPVAVVLFNVWQRKQWKACYMNTCSSVKCDDLCFSCSFLVVLCILLVQRCWECRNPAMCCAVRHISTTECHAERKVGILFCSIAARYCNLQGIKWLFFTVTSTAVTFSI